MSVLLYGKTDDVETPIGKLLDLSLFSSHTSL